MKTRNWLYGQLKRYLIGLPVLLLGFAPLTHGAEIQISTQADFDTYREATLDPGDTVLFERGKVFTGMFAPRAVGAPGNVITITAFGDGPRPIINNNGVIHPHPVRDGATVSAGILLFNAEYVELRGLEVTNNNGGDQEEALIGIHVLAEDTGKYHNHIYIEDNYVHHVNGKTEGKQRGGIHLHGYSPTTSTTATYNDVRIVNNVVNFVGGVGIGTDVDDLADAHDFVGDHRPNAITNLYVAHNWVGNTGRNSVIARDSDYAVYEYNTSAYSSRYSTGNAFFNFRTLGIVFQYNEAYGNTGEADDIDRGGFDADYNARDTIFQYNYSHGNHYFAAIMKRPNANVTFRYNLSVNDLYGGYHFGFQSATDATNIRIYNNTHYFREGIFPEIIGPKLGRTPFNSTFNNNIFYSRSPGTMGVNAENGTNVIYDTNVYFNVEPPASEVNALAEDPLFVAPGDEPKDVDMKNGRDVLAGYRLSSRSPYLENGMMIEDRGALDFWGEAIPEDTASIGASAHAPFSINAGLNDAWISEDAVLQGVFLTVYEKLKILFLSWFTFDSELPLEDMAAFGASDQRWVTGIGSFSGDTVTIDVELTSGGLFNASDPEAGQLPGYGTVMLVFNHCDDVLMTYDFPASGLSGEMTLARVLPDNVMLCEILAQG
jgi:hypothetical protein